MIAYKVVREIDGKLYSCAVRGRGRLEYAPKNTVHAPQGTALFAFRDINLAKAFAIDLYMNTGHHYEVWLCSGKKSTLSLDRLAHSRAPWQKMLDVWRDKTAKRRKTYRAPQGTIFMDCLKLEGKLVRYSDY